jgi:thioredoxin reductase (NADPH)
MSTKDIIIIGGGPAGLAAGLYAKRYNLDTLLIEAMLLGGQAAIAHNVENYPGYSKGVSGQYLIDQMEEQCANFDLEILYESVKAISANGKYFNVLTDSDIKIVAKAVIYAAGATYRQLQVKGENELIGHGVSYCATCDGAFFKGKNIMVVGGGNTAICDALYLANLANKVTVVHRRDQFRAAPVLMERIRLLDNVEIITDTIVTEIVGTSNVETVRVKNKMTGSENEIKVDGVFVAIGQVPNSDCLRDLVEIDAAGYIKTNEDMMTSCPGIFAAGDVRQKALRQIVTAASDGAIAAHCANEWIISNFGQD